METLAISPNGKELVYVGHSGSFQIQLYLRRTDEFEARPIPGTEDGTDPFFSPDGQWIGFLAGDDLKKVPLSGGPPVTLTTLTEGSIVNGTISWGETDTIVFGILNSGLWQVPASGGKARQLTFPDSEKGEVRHSDPDFLPGGKALVFDVRTADGLSNWVLSLETGEQKKLIEGKRPRYAASGHLVFQREASLYAAPFELSRLEVTGPSYPLPQQTRIQGRNGVADFVFSDSGTLVYLPSAGRVDRNLVWVDREGEVEPLAAPPRRYDDPRLSPDGQRLVTQISETNSDVWIYDIPRKTLTRLTFEGNNDTPVWTPDGKRVTFDSDRAGGPGTLFWKPADGSGTADQLTTTSRTNQFATSWTPDGKFLAFREGDDVWVLPLADQTEAKPFLQTSFQEGAGMFSPDGRWLAYVSDESGRFEIYVQPYPGPGGKWQISTEGGSEPLWKRDGQELFYRNGEQMMAVDITTQPSFSPGTPNLLFEGEYFANGGVRRANYDVTPDGQRFVMIKAAEKDEGQKSKINVVLNWFEELKRLVPTDN